MSKKLAGIILLTAAVSGCAQYGAMGTNPIVGGGFVDMDGIGKLHKVYYMSTPFAKNNISDSMMVRCAEIAKSKNKPYFAMYNNLMDAIRDKKEYEPVVWSHLLMSESEVYILLSENDQSGYFNAEKILQDLGQKVKGSK
ncbi:hypothetical protein [Undibacterium luofuense]|uniref:hypothetical protein n=1 Tax=Undibacterium luofuense TaxID=2828733 RepID=UPI0030ED3BE6